VVKNFPADEAPEGIGLSSVGKTEYLERMVAVVDLVPPQAKR
jgi:hypothetical protein